MEYLGEHNKRKVYWWDFADRYEDLPDRDWVCFTMSDILPNSRNFEKFTSNVIKKGVLEFKIHGNVAERIHDNFDDIIIEMEVLDNYGGIDVMTTWHDNEGIASTFWQCFFATCLPDSTNYENLKVICTHFDKVDKRSELKNYLRRFDEGWIPSDEE